MKQVSTLLSALVMVFVTLTGLQASELITQKRVFTLDEFQTFNGATLKNVKVGWESYGTLNEDKSNVILITHYFSGTSHAAGKYAAEDAQVGYWDAIIGPGKAIDTNIYYVVSSDTLVNASAFDENVITTGPATINPDTGKPYGLDFPVVTIRDFVNVQKALLTSLGVTKLHAVVGPSMGSLQAIEWAAAYPDWVERMVSVIGMAQADAWSVAALEQWATPIKADPNWQQGNYAIDQQPRDGMVNALAVITQSALHPKSFNKLFADHTPLNHDALMSITADFPVTQALKQRARLRSTNMDANHLLYLIRACQLFVTGHGGSLAEGLAKVKAKTLFLPASGDVLLMPYMSKLAHDTLLEQGNSSQYYEIPGDFGHLDGIYSVQSQRDVLRGFLASDAE